MANNKEVVYDLDAAAFCSDDFRLYQFKVKRCPRARPHDWTQCPFAHPAEKAKRRDPRKYKYSGTACPEYRRSGICRRGDNCPFAHGVFECWMHPSRYRTQMCTDGGNCKRRVCFFAHTESELRKPEEDPAWLQQQLQDEVVAESQVQQQVQALKALAALINGNSAATPSADTSANATTAQELVRGFSQIATLLAPSQPPTPAAAAATASPAATDEQLRQAASKGVAALLALLGNQDAANVQAATSTSAASELTTSPGTPTTATTPTAAATAASSETNSPAKEEPMPTTCQSSETVEARCSEGESETGSETTSAEVDVAAVEAAVQRADKAQLAAVVLGLVRGSPGLCAQVLAELASKPEA